MKSGIILMGAAPDTGNLGVSALCSSMLFGLASRCPESGLVVLDCGRGVRQSQVHLGDRPIRFELVGAYNTRRLYRPESLWRISLSTKMGGAGNPAAKRLLTARAALDISGGDSFTDLYGPRRFEAVTRLKLAALQHGVPLVLLPQTYGPFTSPQKRAIAERIVRGSVAAWARDRRSYEQLTALLGSAFDPSKHHCGVDVAFLLPSKTPVMPLPSLIEEWLADTAVVVAGVNVSGLLMNFPGACAPFGFRADYEEIVLGLIKRLLGQPGASVVLVPHVRGPSNGPETDLIACQKIRSRIPAESRARVAALPDTYDESEVKSVIARMNWFCGTRMHSTIAALSSGVPTSAIAYSLKTQGVFETCSQGRHVADPRILSTEESIELLWRSWRERESTRQSLREVLPSVILQAEAQMDCIAQLACGPSSSRRTG